jgi:hypothetical protein
LLDRKVMIIQMIKKETIITLKNALAIANVYDDPRRQTAYASKSITTNIDNE